MSANNRSRFCFALHDKPWSQLAPGLREKAHVSGGRLFRLLEFSEEFQEPDWCLKGHVGYVLDGEIIVNVDGEFVSYRPGDAIDLPPGVRHRHDATIRTATLFLIEERGDEG